MEEFIQLRKKITELEQDNRRYKETEKKLRAINQQLQAGERQLSLRQEALMRTEQIAHIGSWDWDVATDTVTWSDELFRIFRLNPENGTVSYAEHPKIYSPESMQRLDMAVQNLLKTGEPYEIDLEIIRGDGSNAFCTVHGFAKKDKAGNVIQLYGSFQDITERKKAEEQLKALNQQLIANDQQLRAANQQMQANAQQLMAALQQLQAGEQQLRAANQQLKANEEQLRRANEKLEESEKQFRQLFENMTQAFALHEMIYDEKNKPVDYRFHLINKSFEKLTGIVASDYIGKTVKQVLPQIEQIWIDNYGKVAKTGNPMQFEHYSKEFEKYYHVTAYSPKKDFFATVFTDTTKDYLQRKQITEAKELAERNEIELNKVQEITHIGSWYMDISTNEVVWSRELYKMYGFDPTKPVPSYTEHMKLFTPESWKLLSGSITKISETGVPYELELNTLRKDGTNGWIWARGEAVYDKENKLIGLWGAAQDITERKSVAIELQRAKEKAEENENRYKNLIETASDAIYMLSEDGIFIEANQGALNMLGKERDEIINHNVCSIDPNYTIKRFLDFWKVIPFDKQLIFESTHLHKNGTLIPVEISAKKYERYGKVYHYCIARDITDRKTTEEAILENQKRYKKAQAIGHVGNWEYETSSTNFWASDEAKRIYGFDLNVERFSTELVESCIPERERVHQALVDLLEHNKSYDLVFDIITNDKGIRKTIHSIAEVERDAHGKPYKVTGVISDITQSKKVELELIKAKEKAEESDRLKSAFLANMSHEIRTPMNGILGFTNLLKEPDLSGEEQQKYIDIIQRSGARMLSTVNDIIDISRIESGVVELTVSEVNIHEQLKYLHSFFNPEAAKKGIRLVLKNDRSELDNRFVTDVEKFNSIVTNLIKNAIKFTNQGTIELGYDIEREHGSTELTFYVKDSGIGIPKNRHEAIFERFVQADIDDSQAKQGSGLGLAISKAYTTMLGGKIWVDSEVGVGSTFYFTIKHQGQSRPNSGLKNDTELSNENGIGNKLTILVVEDDETSQELISIVVDPFAKQIIKVNTGSEVVETCRNNRNIDLILMDIQLPGINGYEATRQIRQFNKEVVILAQTAYALAGDREKAINMGCNDYISKPINNIELLTLIQKYFKKYN